MFKLVKQAVSEVIKNEFSKIKQENLNYVSNKGQNKKIELNTEIATLINFNYKLIKPISVKLIINDDEV